MSEAVDASDSRKAQLRNELYNYLIDDYESIQNFQYRQLHFHLPSTESFLRFHQPEQFGDLLLDVRPTVKFVSEQHLPINGFEEGRIYNGYRFVYPLFDDETYVGSVEASISSTSILTILSKLYPNQDFDFMIEKEVVEDTVFTDSMSNYVQSDISYNYYYDKDVQNVMSEYNTLLVDDDETFLSILRSSFASQGEQETSFTCICEYNDTYYSVVFKTITNILNEPVAYLLSIEQSFDYPLIINGFNRQIAGISAFAFTVVILGWILLYYHNRLRMSSEIDYLTNIHNRQKFFELATKEFKQVIRHGIPASILMLDIDHFKIINDRYGHHKGDMVLKGLAKLISSSIRENDLFARWGGEEFIFFLPHTTVEEAEKVAEKIRVLIYHAVEDELMGVTVSIGISMISSLGDLEATIQQADAALYHAKNSGRNKVSTYKKETRKHEVQL